MRSSDLAALEEGGGAPALEILSLGKTNIDDDVVPYISACQSLRVLDVAATRLTSELHLPSMCHALIIAVGEAVFSIIDACPRLVQLDFTKCRGVPLGALRSMFEVRKHQSCDARLD